MEFFHYSIQANKNVSIDASLPSIVYSHRQSHYIEVAQGGVCNRARHNWLWIFSLFWAKKNSKEKKNIKEILCNFLLWTLQYLKKKFDPENMKKTPSKVAHYRPKIFFSSIANRPKTSPNFIFCSIKMSPCATSIYLMTLATGNKCSIWFSTLLAF